MTAAHEKLGCLTPKQEKFILSLLVTFIAYILKIYPNNSAEDFLFAVMEI